MVEHYIFFKFRSLRKKKILMTAVVALHLVLIVRQADGARHQFGAFSAADVRS